MSGGVVRDFLAAIIAGIAFIVMYNVLAVDLVVSLVVTVGCLAGGYLAFSKTAIEIQMEQMGIRSEYIKNALHEGEEKLSIIRQLGREIDDTQVDAVAEAVENLFESIRKDPASIRSIRQVFTVFLDMTINAFRSYKEIYRASVNDSDNRETLEKTQNTFVELEKLFIRANEKILSRHFNELDTEVDLMDKLIKSEGI